jgi:hypothetical protein
MCGEAGAEESDEQVLFHGSSVEAVVELGDIPSEVFALDPEGGFRAGTASGWTA